MRLFLLNFVAFAIISLSFGQPHRRFSKRQTYRSLYDPFFPLLNYESFGTEIVGNEVDMKDPVHGIKMGISNDHCDNAKTNLNLDWDGSPINYTCFNPKNPIPYSSDIPIELEECETLPKSYMPLHHCMNETISYSHIIPTHGDHRPLWPIFGEYQFVPPQRWLHNIEHGAIVMLYHPCTHPYLVNQLRHIVTRCVRKHVITPSNLMPEDKPMALVAWGCRLMMNQVDPNTVVPFIKAHAMHGPEGTYSKEGQYTQQLLKKATIPPGSDYEDARLCPEFST